MTIVKFKPTELVFILPMESKLCITNTGKKIYRKQIFLSLIFMCFLMLNKLVKNALT